MKKTLKEFLDEVVKISPIGALQTAQKMIELEALENWVNLMWGVDLEINVIKSEVKQGRWFGHGVIEAAEKEKKRNNLGKQ